MQLKHLFYTPEEFVHMDALPVRMGSRKKIVVEDAWIYYIGEARYFTKQSNCWKRYRKQQYK